ncbi:hypothetical protein Tco_1476990 [Tanacetum coccineum]
MTTVTSSSSSSNWLTRLRTSKGFPDSTHTDLEHFLSTSLPQSQSQSQFPPPKPLLADVTSPHPLPPHDVISNVLSDLFCFNNNTSDTRKTSRKQINPKQCVFAKNSLVLSSPTSRKQVRPNVCVVAKNTKVRECGEEEEVEEEWEDFTETEVTVIDTSVANWKFEKVLYRRKNEWRVGEKRRRDGGEEDGEGERNNKKNKKKLKLCGEWKARDKENGEKTKQKKKKKKLKFVNKEGDVAGSKFVQVYSSLDVMLDFVLTCVAMIRYVSLAMIRQ